MSHRALAIHVAPICYSNNVYDQFRVYYRVHNTVVALTDAIQILASEFLASRWSWLRGQCRNPGNDLAADLVGNALQFFRGGTLDQDAIACHAA